MSWNIQNAFKKCRLMRSGKNGMNKKKKNSTFNRKKASICLQSSRLLCAVNYVQFLSFIRIIQKFAAVISLSTIWLRAISFARIFRSAWIRMTLMLLFSHFALSLALSLFFSFKCCTYFLLHTKCVVSAAARTAAAVEWFSTKQTLEPKWFRIFSSTVHAHIPAFFIPFTCTVWWSDRFSFHVSSATRCAFL